MFRKSLIFILLLLVSCAFSVRTATAATQNTIAELQIRILLLKIEQLKLQLAELLRAQTPRLDQGVVNTSTRQAVVNILCENRSASPFKSISGSGVTIDPRGIILTNAHIGQYFLVKDYPTLNSMRCIIRTGSPATPTYTARLMYLPPGWIQNNRTAIKTASATGTGEDDYALLAISGSVTGAPLPASFPYVPIDDNVVELPNDYPALLASYPGELVGSVIIAKDLTMSSAVTNVHKGYYFDSDPDKNLGLFDISGTIISQAGSSGGAAVSLISGKLIGIIVTATEGITTSERELRALNLAHVNRSMQKYTGDSLGQFLKQDPQTAAANFELNTAPQERALLIQ